MSEKTCQAKKQFIPPTTFGSNPIYRWDSVQIFPRCLLQDALVQQHHFVFHITNFRKMQNNVFVCNSLNICGFR